MSKITFGKFELHYSIIRGTKLTVDMLLDLLAKGKTVEDILKTYPKARKKDINIALKYAAKAVSDYESIRETEELLSDPNILKELKEAEEDYKKGKFYKWEDVKKELEIKRQAPPRNINV